MYSLTIKNLSVNEILEGYVSSLRPFSEEVEEHLYTQWDLTSCDSTVGLLNGEVIRFSYHDVEFFDVWVEEGTGIVFVRDADLDLDFDDCDYEVGFDPYCGCYTDDC